LRRSGPLLAAAIAAIATILIVAAYDAYRINVATPGAIGVASEPIGVPDNNATATTPAVPVVLESTPLEPERTAALQPPISATNAEAPKRASVRQRPVSISATKRTRAHQRSMPGRQAPVSATPPVTHGLATARVGAQGAKTSKATGPDPWQAMQVSLARCDGDLIARFVCDQRVRRHFCEGRWGETPECASGVANDHGQ
jgi:hypothetical protein